MNSPPTTSSSQLLSTPDARPKRAVVSEEPGKKPKKPNSEIRKQQNRIASRNYREKRKRKLQYLQQLIRDDSEGRQESEPSPEQHEVYPRSLSADYDIAGPSSSPYQMSSNRVFGASSTVANEAILTATVASLDSHHLAVDQAYPSYPPHWNMHIYSPSPPASIPWNMPPAWMSSLDYSTQAAATTRPSMYRYHTHPSQPSFQHPHTSSPSHHQRDFLPNTDVYGYGADYASHSQASGNPNVSLPTSYSYSPYHQGRRTAPD
ncbi:uncharacterized protein J4E78_006452 [Alternaria triticimaculans]|uniref:uncharacterized protein n=1 Tax=Alternaria triticimaculans TaxID=297637 RepID=UPI0020C2E288|nr:uncharacterized protein J4E78_006452 [Alternaria triticimaculans]KAI4656563.1 hypothetical protein J4E78_006452 [Alternaria triticimaculans]